MSIRKNDFFLPVVIACYVIAITLSFMRIYVFHAYPTFVTEDDMPGTWETLTDIPSLLTP